MVGVGDFGVEGEEVADMSAAAAAEEGMRRSRAFALVELAVDEEAPSCLPVAGKLAGRSVGYQPDSRTLLLRVLVDYHC